LEELSKGEGKKREARDKDIPQRNTTKRYRKKIPQRDQRDTTKVLEER